MRPSMAGRMADSPRDDREAIDPGGWSMTRSVSPSLPAVLWDGRWQRSVRKAGDCLRREGVLKLGWRER
jgi:hypothetical protein